MYHLEFGAENLGRPEKNCKFYSADDAFYFAKGEAERGECPANCYLVTGVAAPQLMFAIWRSKTQLKATLHGNWKPQNWETDWPQGLCQDPLPFRPRPGGPQSKLPG